MNYDHLMDALSRIGVGMYISGAEIHRVEDTITRILTHYHAEDKNVFAITSNLTISATFEGHTYTVMKRMPSISPDFSHLAEWNALSRKICSTDEIDEEEFLEDTKKIENLPSQKWYFSLLGYALVPFFFSLFFGGDLIDSLCSMVLGMGMFLADFFLRKHLNQLIYTVLVSFVIGILGALFYRWGFGHNLDKIYIGTVMLFIPGMVMTNAFRDMFLGDTISGTLKLVESIILTFAISLGFGFAIFLLAKDNVNAPSDMTTYPVWVYLLSGMMATVGFALIFHATRKMYIASAIGAGITSVLLFFLSPHMNTFLSSFIITVVAGFFAEVSARVVKAPVVGLLSLSFMPLYPGRSLFYSFSYLVSQDMQNFQTRIIITGYTMLGLACGVLISALLFHYMVVVFQAVHRCMKEKKQSAKK